jgi:hypothetical protein
MRTFIFLSSIALIYIARANPLPEIPLWTDSLPENTIASSDLELDDFSDTKLLFPASELFADFSDPLLETELFADSSDAVLHSSCGADDSEFQLYGKRDDGFCGTGTEVEPVPLLKLPDLSDLEASPGSIHMERPNLKTIPIPRIPEFSSDDDEFCPKPGRRLCCLGPLGGLVPHLGLWAVVHDCRGMTILSGLTKAPRASTDCVLSSMFHTHHICEWQTTAHGNAQPGTTCVVKIIE